MKLLGINIMKKRCCQQVWTFYITGPVASALCHRYSCRSVVFWGAILTCVGQIISAYAPNIEFLFFSYSIVGGKYNTFSKLNRDSDFRCVMRSLFPIQHLENLFDFTAAGVKCRVTAVESLLVLHHFLCFVP